MKKTYKIVDKFKYCISFSLLVMLVGVVCMIVNSARGIGAFNYDVEFAGGTSIQADIGREFDNDEMTGVIREVTGQQSPQVQKTGNGTQVAVKLLSIDSDTRAQLVQALTEKYGITADDVTYSDVSATVSASMKNSAILAVSVALACMLIYVSIRFRDVKIGASGILALFHDSMIMVAFYAILRIPLNYSFIAAILTILGYSINATIVIFDRIRENRPLMKKSTHVDMVDLSVTQTMRRSVFTSLTVFFSILFLIILGVPSIKEFALPIEIGVVFGGFSSVMLAGSFWCMMNRGQDRKIALIAARAAQAAAEKEAQEANKAARAAQSAESGIQRNAGKTAGNKAGNYKGRKKKG